MFVKVICQNPYWIPVHVLLLCYDTFFSRIKKYYFLFTSDSLLTNPPGLLLVFVIFSRCLQIINLAILRTEIKDQLSSLFCLLKSRRCFPPFFSPLTPYLFYTSSQRELLLVLRLLSQFIEYFRMQSKWLENICLVLSALISPCLRLRSCCHWLSLQAGG